MDLNQKFKELKLEDTGNDKTYVKSLSEYQDFVLDNGPGRCEIVLEHDLNMLNHAKACLSMLEHDSYHG